MRYVIGVGEDEENYSLVTSPLGGVLIYFSHEDACDAARMVAAGNLSEVRPDAGVFVFKLKATALYLPYKHGDEKLVDETVVEPNDLEDTDAQPN